MAETQEEIVVSVNPDNAGTVDHPVQIERFDRGLEEARIGFIATLKAEIDEGNLELPVNPSDWRRANPDMALRTEAQRQAVLAQNVRMVLGGYMLAGPLKEGESVSTTHFDVPVKYLPDPNVPFGSYEVVGQSKEEAIRTLRQADPSTNPQLL